MMNNSGNNLAYKNLKWHIEQNPFKSVILLKQLS